MLEVSKLSVKDLIGNIFGFAGHTQCPSWLLTPVVVVWKQPYSICKQMDVSVFRKTLFTKTDTGSIWLATVACLTHKLYVNYIFPSRLRKIIFLFIILSITKITARIVTGNLSKRSLIYFKKVKYASIKRDMFWWPESHWLPILFLSLCFSWWTSYGASPRGNPTE